MKHFRLLFPLLTLLLAGTLNTWAETKIGSWDLTKTSSDWIASGNVAYFSQPYGYKKADGTLINKNIADFSINGITEIKVGFKCLQNGGSTSKITIYLVDKDGKIVSDGVIITPVNKNQATQTTYQYATFTQNLQNAAGFMMKVTTFGKNILVNGAEYTITYETSSSCTTPTFTIADKTISLSEASDVYDMSNLAINKGGSTGAITYSCSDENVIIDKNHFLTETAGTYTINATMAADNTYCEAATSFAIIVYSCTAPAEPLALSLSSETVNLGADGSAQVTFSTTDGNNAETIYSITPEAGAAISGNTATFTRAGTYTLTATQSSSTIDGTTYCSGSDSKTITVTANPVLYFTTAPADPITFAEVECGGNTPLAQKQQISLQGYNLTADVTVTVTGDYKIARTQSTALADYATRLTLPKTANGVINSTYTNVYVISTPPEQTNSATTGTVTFSAAGAIPLVVNLSTPVVSCHTYTLTLNDRGSKIAGGNYYAGAEIPQPADPTGVCTEPINYIFDGWATAEVADGSTAYTPVSFPYTMPKANTTLYAVYRYLQGESDDFQIADADVDLISGQDYILTADNNKNVEYALSNVSSSSVKGKMNTKNVSIETVTEGDETWYEIQNVTDNTILWTLVGNETDGYSFLNKSTGTYLTASDGTLSLSDMATTKYVISHPNSTSWKVFVQQKGGNYLSAYQVGSQVLFSDYKSNTLGLYLYVRKAQKYYTTFPSCAPFIEGTADITITSAKDIWVEAVTPLTVSAQNLDRNADNASVSISAASLSDVFTIKNTSTQGAGSKSVTLTTGCKDATYDASLTVVYKPSAANTIDEGKIALRVYRTGGTTTYAADTITVRGRSLPAEFVLAAKTADGWVALPADLGSSSTDAVKYPYAISVDDEAAPVKAAEAPRSAIYAAAMRSATNTAAAGLRFTAGGKYLQGSSAQGEPRVWLSSENSGQMQSWELHSADLANYFVRLRASEADRYLSYNATQGKIANYKQMSHLRILPVEQTCTRFDAPKIDVHALASTSATLIWSAIAGVTDYEYSIDGGIVWQTCSNVETHGTEIKWTLAGLISETKYTVSIRAKAADGETNCSASDSETFTTPDCDDVPVDLWVSATANAATVMWSAKAATATVNIYADEQGTTLVKTVPDAATPCKIVGLEQNTHYYYQVLAGGTCASAIANFWTESNEVSIVEWEKEAVVVDLNTEVTGADEVSILVEGQKTHGNNDNVADDLFFSKYFEAKANLKLIAIFNGTKDAISLSDTRVVLSKGKEWSSSNEILDLSPLGSIPANTEYIFFSYTSTSTTTEGPAVSCIKESLGFNHSTWFPTNSFAANDLKMKLPFAKSVNLNISGDRSMALQRKVNGEWVFIDLFGAGNETTADNSQCRTVNDEIEVTLADGSTTTTKMNDDDGWYCADGTHYVTDATIPLSTNRYLLIRKNSVKNGLNAVKDNITDFTTLCSEWEGAPCGKFGDSEEDNTTTCVNFAYVSDFNYNDYYTTYDSVANLEIKGNPNADGTYTVPVPKLDTMACTNLRLQLKKGGTVIASHECKVPIIIDQSTTTGNTAVFGEKLTDEVCKTCDVVVRNRAQLSHTKGGKQQFRDMYVYTGSSLHIPAGETISLDKVRMFATNDDVSYAVINNSNASDAAISVKEVSHVKRIDGRYWYPFSLPYDCKISEIDQLNGQSIGVYGMDWGIKYYDGHRRQSDGNSETTYGEVSKYWTMMPENGVLKAYTGYIIGLFVPAADEPLMKSVNFPPAAESAYTEGADSKQTTVTNWADNLGADKRHHGWNFVGSPYISLFGAKEGEGLCNTGLQMGYTNRQGEQKDMDHIYVSIPDGGNSNTYTQSLASGVTLKPFTAYFVQAVDPVNGQSNTLELTYSKTQRQLLAPQRTSAAGEDILVELTLGNGNAEDNAGLWVGNDHCNEYEIGRDLTKMYAASGKPQLYTVAPYGRMAYQALPDAQAHAVPLGIYVPAGGDYTLSLDRALSRVEEAESVCLLRGGKVVADLLQADYTLSSDAGGVVDGYTLDIRRAPEVVTATMPAAGDMPYLIVRDGLLTVANLPAEAAVQVYDVLGRVCFATRADAPAAGVVVAQKGVYTVVVTAANRQYVLKTLLH